MNILIFSWRGPKHPHAGGAELVTHEHAKAWVKAGHSVTLFTSYFFEAKHYELIDGVNILRYGGQAFGVQIQAFIWYIFKNKMKYDIVIDHFHGLPFFTPLYIKTKKIAFIHEVAKEVWGLNGLRRPFNLVPALLGPLCESAIFKLFYKNISFITVSNSTKKDLIDWGILEKNIKIIQNGTNILKPNPFPNKEKNKTIIFLGALAKDKGVEDALKVFNIVNKKNKNIKFWIVGKGSKEYINKLEKIVQKIGISKNLKFWGFVSEKKKFELLARAHILINPSVREGWGLVNIEANAMGTPVVGYRSPGIVDSVKDKKTGFLFEIGDLEALGQALIKILNNKDQYNKIRINAIKWSDHFHWPKKTKESLDFITKLK